MTIDCRLCLIKDPHVHIRANAIEPAFHPTYPREFRLKDIEAIDFALPAVKVEGRWWVVKGELVDLIWPEFQRLRNLVARPKKNAGEDDEESEAE